MKTEYNNILQSVESDKEMLNNEWNSINWNSVEYNIFKIQKRIFEAEKVGNYSVFLFSYKLCSSRLWLKPHGRVLGEKGGVILLTYPTRSIFLGSFVACLVLLQVFVVRFLVVLFHLYYFYYYMYYYLYCLFLNLQELHFLLLVSVILFLY